MQVDKNDPAMPVPAFAVSDGYGGQTVYQPIDGVPLRLWIATHLLAGSIGDSACAVAASWALDMADRLIERHNATCESNK